MQIPKNLKTIILAIITAISSLFIKNNSAPVQNKIAPEIKMQSTWSYPIFDPTNRVTLNPFGILHDKNYYLGKENLFPYNRFYSYHAGVDFETTAQEKNSDVPFYAISDGKIIYLGSVSGYGGVVLETLSDGIHTALYGHIKLSSVNFKVGDSVKTGDKLGLLGDEFSSETGGERKHLHLGIYRGTNQYFHGYETSLETLNQNWEDPLKFLENQNAVNL